MLPPRRRPQLRWTDKQREILESPYHLTVAWGGNGTGKSSVLAEMAIRGIAGELHWQPGPGPRTVMVLGRSWPQLAQTIRYLWRLMPSGWLRDEIRYQGGALMGQRTQVFDVVGGPGKGGELRLALFRAKRLAGPRAELILTDEPCPEDVYTELWPRLLGEHGRMVMFFTPTLGTAYDLGYIWQMVDDPAQPWAGEIQVPLTLANVTPRGGLVEVPWLTQEEIDRTLVGISEKERACRAGLSRYPTREGVYFSAWGEHLISEEPPPAGALVAVGIDHGSRPGAERVIVVAMDSSIEERVWVLGDYKSDGRTESADDARGILTMLSEAGLALEDIDLWVGDRAHHGDHRGGRKSNDRLRLHIARVLGIDTHQRGWMLRLPESLRRLRTPRKYEGSVWEGVSVMHQLMVDRRFLVHPRCKHLVADIETWEGSTRDPSKDGIDGCRYAIQALQEYH